MFRHLLVALMCCCSIGSATGAAGQTWVEIDGKVYGAKPDDRGPIGGGVGYSRIVTEGDYTVTNLDELIEALAKAKSGEVVFIPDETVIDLTARIYIENLILEVPAGVTLAGNRGHNGSLGAQLTNDALKAPAMIRPAGPDVRVTGLRLRGSNTKRYLELHRRAFRRGGKGRQYYYKFPTSVGILMYHANLEVDNCEITGFSQAGIYLVKGQGHLIHHNYIHHCQFNGLGYGVSHNTASSTIEYNLFDWNRHSIAGTGRPGCSYIARHNVELGESLSHCFDMHGGRDRKDGTDIAGTRIEIHNNTFRARKRAIVIRGVPQDVCQVYRNWFVAAGGGRGPVKSPGNTRVEDNLYGPEPTAAR